MFANDILLNNPGGGNPVVFPPQLWLKGDTLTGLNGASLATWGDSSAANNTATGSATSFEHPTLVTSGLNALNIARFNGPNQQHMVLPSLLLSGDTEGSAFYVAKITNDPPLNGLLTGPVLGNFGTDTSANHVPFTDGVVYDDFLSTERKTTVNPTTSLATWHIAGFQSKANDWRFYLNGGLEFSTVINTVGVNTLSGTVATFIGKSSSSSSTITFDGDLAEVIYVDSFLTQANREKIEGYLAHKWGITSVLAANHPYKTTAPTAGATSFAATANSYNAPTSQIYFTVSYAGSPTGVEYSLDNLTWTRATLRANGVAGSADYRTNVITSPTGLQTVHFRQKDVPANNGTFAVTILATLNAITLSDAAYVTGVAESGTLIGPSSGGTVASGALPAGYTVNLAVMPRTWAWDGTGVVSAPSVTFTETHPNATNSGRISVVPMAITASAGGVNDGLLTKTVSAPVTVNNPGNNFIANTLANAHFIEFPLPAGEFTYWQLQLKRTDANNLVFVGGLATGNSSSGYMLNGAETVPFSNRPPNLGGGVAGCMIRAEYGDGVYKVLYNNAEATTVRLTDAPAQIGSVPSAIPASTSVGWKTFYGPTPAYIRYGELGVDFRVIFESHSALTGHTIVKMEYLGTPSGYQYSQDGVTWFAGIKVSNAVAGVAYYRTPNLNLTSVNTLYWRQTDNTARNGSVIVTAPAPAMIGQNIGSWGEAGSPRRIHTNMFKQSYLQILGTIPGIPETNPNLPRNTAGYTDAMGWPLKPGIICWYVLPEQQNVEVTLQMKWTGGPLTIVQWSMEPNGGVANYTQPTYPDANTIEWKITADRAAGIYGQLSGGLKFETLDEANPPKNMTLCIKGEDLTKYFNTDYINWLKLLPGRLRFMDQLWVNLADYFRPQAAHFNKPGAFTWANRPRQDNGIGAPLALEDMIELCNLSGRPLLWNVNVPCFYEANGIDWLQKSIDMLYFGTGAVKYSDGPNVMTAGVVKHIAPEMGNEIWNASLGGYRGSWSYLAYQGMYSGRGATFVDGDGATMANNTVIERNHIQKLFGETLAARVPNYGSRTKLILGCQMGGGLDNLNFAAGWNAAKAYINEVARAPYLPNDPNAGGQAASYTDRSPAGVIAYLNSVFPATMVELTAGANASLAAGFGHSLYEFNIAVVSLDLTVAQKKALYSSPLYYDFWKNTYLPQLLSLGGDAALYSDMGNITNAAQQEWSVEKIPNSIYSQAWNACVDFSIANPVVVN